MSLRVIYMGSPEFAVAPLEALAAHHQVLQVYTAPDAIRSRGKRLVPTAVREAAEHLHIPVRTPRSLTEPEVQAELCELAPDVVCVAAYGLLLPPWLLQLPRYGCLNIHGSLLPRWRGAAPIERALLAGDEVTGISIMAMKEGLDTGSYCEQRSVGIGEKSLTELSRELSALGAEALLKVLDDAEQSRLLWTPQNEVEVTYAPKVQKSELYLNPLIDAMGNLRRIRASSPARPARCRLNDRNLTILNARPLVPEAYELAEGLNAGDVRWRSKVLLFGCDRDAFEVLSLKPEGAGAMDAASFVAGKPAVRTGQAQWSALE